MQLQLQPNGKAQLPDKKLEILSSVYMRRSNLGVLRSYQISCDGDRDGDIQC
ncbi:hypothetical protein HETIRDRAFT_169132 [Heterobasidion irregulare TC 32-1]|uniref:Uncharacterized protein n=1 Tax=Heterobasidion irregulare (strain TC 32-1) TaxID=747525 RepID=W4K3J2_HETIT|nr:uncharacterized protein HETIRDRAFT_169132 [Heterobasidion irregulare TC 32-1]ETW80377.1 hypothetical protein HETIRDRAFT_169132 [Heterobasidion irregulare TC 32-1]